MADSAVRARSWAVRNLRDEPRLGRVDGELRAARRGEADEVQPLQADGQRHARRRAAGRRRPHWSGAGSRNGSVALKPVA